MASRSLHLAVLAGLVGSVLATTGSCASGGGGTQDDAARIDAPNGLSPDANEPAFDARPPSDTGPDTGPACIDADEDGYPARAGCGEQPDCDDLDGSVHPGAVEVCNGHDDDCNGMVDDGLPEQRCGVGACETTVPGCERGVVPTCTPREPSPETCNAIDDDCNGMVDDGFDAPVVCGVGACQRMVPACGGGMPPRCVPGEPGTEVCNGIDDDCDGMVDEELPTTTCGVGECRRTMPSCVDGRPQACTPFPPSAEVCNGRDDDCDGVVDDGFGTVSCGVGFCQRTVLECVMGMPNVCVPGSPSPETCNNIDDDCNGAVDDGLGTSSCGLGACRRTVPNCISGVPQTCVPGSPSPEICGNGLDEDCDGVADNGCRPPNDTCATAIVLTGTHGTRTGDSIAGASATVTDCAFGRDLWYRITLSQRSILYVDTFGSSFDTSLSIRSGCSSPPVACEDDDCSTLQDIAVAELAAGTHYVVVHTRGSTTGTVNLRWQTLRAGNGPSSRLTTNGSYNGTTSGTGVIAASCGASASGPENLHYFTLCPDTSRTITAETCSAVGFDTVVHVRSGADTELACNDDSCGLRSRVTAPVSGPGLFGVYVDGYGSGSGMYTLTISGL